MNIDNVRQFRFAQLVADRSEEIARLKASWGWFVAGGIALIVLGIITIGTAVASTIVTMGFLGACLLIAGLIQIVHAFSPGKWGGFLGPFLCGFFLALSGILILRSPGASAVTLTFLLAPLLMGAGIARAFGAAAYAFPRWGVSVLSGIVTFMLGMFIWNQWPSSGLWVIGTMVGVEIVVSGIATASMGFALRSVDVPRHAEKLAA